ncbi:M12 family metallo-peptidase [Bythopirellula polymerisocia]|uniref:M12 family metallo-peptidase n=1 Tax=Bythopirellula polymerisocia TaxID=2528003 RepID=UPI0011B39997|nr:M12 family metallo-peptidase [Bythopirellula polymerisocia]
MPSLSILTIRRLLILGIGLLCEWSATVPVWAEVVVLSNRTLSGVTVELHPFGETRRSLSISPGDSKPVFFTGSLNVRFGQGIVFQTFDLSAGSAYFFKRGPDGSSLDLERIGLGKSDLQPKTPIPGKLSAPHKYEPFKIPVKIAVDDDEPTHRSIWEPRLRERVAAASRILEQNCGVQLEVVDVATWDSNDDTRDFFQSMQEFEQKVPTKPARLVIGFSSQYELTAGRTHMGGSRGTLHPYILLKERARNVRESHRLQLLVHELGHFLGATHSPEPSSVMRPVFDVMQPANFGGHIQFDPVNSLLMSLLSDELRQRSVTRFADVSLPTKQRMIEIYEVLADALPNDPAAAQYKRLVSMATSPRLVQEVREVLRLLTQMAKMENARAEKRAAEGGIQGANNLTGDDLTARFVREAAAIANEFQSPDANQSMLLALGIFMDSEGVLRNFPLTSGLVSQVETEEASKERQAFLGNPTMRGRTDLAKHFFVSAHLAVALGGTTARGVGLAKEMLDANGGTGFSFVDMAANRAGILFAEKMLAGKFGLEQIAEEFTVNRYLPEIDDLAEGMQGDTLRTRYAKDDGALINAELEKIEQRILTLPVYQ